MFTGFHVFKCPPGRAKNTPTFPRGGLSAVFTVQKLDLVGAVSLAVTIEHENVEDTTSTPAGAFGSITTVTVATTEVNGLKEQIRFALSLTATNAWEGVT